MSRRIDYPAELAALTRVMPNGCWHFTGRIVPNGYGQLGRNKGAHRLAWEIANGRPVPDGLQVDHLCHNLDPTCRADKDCLHRRCVNPDHLEAVSQHVNILRGKSAAAAHAIKTHCKWGHEFTPENTYYRPDRYARMCRACARARRAAVA